MTKKAQIHTIPSQVLIYSPIFFKYVYETWLDGHGRYPSTGFLSLLLAIHICDEVRRTAAVAAHMDKSFPRSSGKGRTTTTRLMLYEIACS